MQQDIWRGDRPAHEGTFSATGDSSLLLPCAAGQVEEPVLVACHTLNNVCHLPADCSAQTKSITGSERWILGQTKTVMAAALQVEGGNEGRRLQAVEEDVAAAAMSGEVSMFLFMMHDLISSGRDQGCAR